jgi:hypothetical protein
MKYTRKEVLKELKKFIEVDPTIEYVKLSDVKELLLAKEEKQVKDRGCECTCHKGNFWKDGIERFCTVCNHKFLSPKPSEPMIDLMDREQALLETYEDLGFRLGRYVEAVNKPLTK